MKKANVLWIMICVMIIISVLSIFVFADKSPVRLIERRATANIYHDSESKEFIAQLFAKPVNMKDLSGEYKPYEEVTSFYSDNGNLMLAWNGKSVKLKIYAVDDKEDKKFLKDMKEEEKGNLGFKTTIRKNIGSYYYTHDLTKIRSKQPKAVGYDVETENVDCKEKGLMLICGEQRIDFSDAAELQNLTVNVFDDKVEFSGEDLSYIDPTIDLDNDDLYSNGEVTYRYDVSIYDFDSDIDDFYVGHYEGNDKYYRAYLSWSLDDINSTWDITNVKLSWYDYTHKGSEDTVKFYELIHTDVGDWTPDTEEEEEALYDAIPARNLYTTDTGPTEDAYNVADFGSDGADRLESDKDNGYNFYVGLTGDEGNDESRVGIEGKNASKPPYLNITYSFTDTTPPTTTANATSPPNGSSYSFGDTTTEDVNITLACSDSGGAANASGCDYTDYCVDTNNTCDPSDPYTIPIEISAHGTSYIRYYSQDYNGNTEEVQDKTIIIDRSPNATNVGIISSSPDAGDDLFCNYSYASPGDYEEKDSTYNWKKNGLSQNISFQVLGKSNLSVGDNWSCKVIPNNGIANGTEAGSSNVTILGTIKNPKMYVEDSLVWSPSGYYSDKETITSFANEINSEILNCTPDAEGYCNISIIILGGV